MANPADCRSPSTAQACHHTHWDSPSPPPPGEPPLQRQESRPPASTVPSRTRRVGLGPRHAALFALRPLWTSASRAGVRNTENKRLQPLSSLWASALRCPHRCPSVGGSERAEGHGGGPRRLGHGPASGTAVTAPGSGQPEPLSLRFSLPSNLGVESQMLEFSLFFYIGFI